MWLKKLNYRLAFELGLISIIILLLGTVTTAPQQTAASSKDCRDDPRELKHAEQQKQQRVVAPGTDVAASSSPTESDRPPEQGSGHENLEGLAGYSGAEEFAEDEVKQYANYVKLSDSQIERLRARGRQTFLIGEAYRDDPEESDRRMEGVESAEQILGPDLYKEYDAANNSSINRGTQTQNLKNSLFIAKVLQLSDTQQQQLLSAMNDPARSMESVSLYLSREASLSSDQETELTSLMQRITDDNDEMMKSIGIDPKNIPDKYLTEGRFYDTNKIDLDIIRSKFGPRLTEQQYLKLYEALGD